MAIASVSKSNKQVALTMYEKINMNAVNACYNSTGISDKCKSMLKRIILKAPQGVEDIDDGWFEHKVQYGRKDDRASGRLYPDAGIQNLYNEVRTAIVSGTVIDVDVSNCISNVLKHLASQHGLECDQLNHLVRDRSDFFALNGFGLVSVFANKKKLMSVLLGKTSGSRVQNLKILHKFLHVTLTEALLEVPVYKDLWDTLVPDPKKSLKTYSKIGSFLSRIYHQIENKISMSAVEFFEQNGLVVNTIIHDGIHVRCTELFEDELMDHLHCHVNNVMGFPLKWKQTIVEGGLNIEGVSTERPVFGVLDESIKKLEVCDESMSSFIYNVLENQDDDTMQFKCVNHNGGLFYQFDNGLWKEQPSSASIRLFIIDVVVPIIEEYIETETDKVIADRLKTVRHRYRQVTSQNNIIKAFSNRIEDHEFVEKLDKNVNLLGFNDCVFDCRTGLTRKGTEDDLISMSVGYDFPHTEPTGYQRVKALYDTIMPNKDTRMYLFKALSSCLDGRTSKALIHQFTGALGSNGKTVTAELMRGALGKYSVSVPSERFCGSGSTGVAGADAALLTLRGARLAYTSEPPAQKTLDVSKLKSFSGDELTARTLYCKNVITFKCQAKLFILLNKQLKADTSDGGFARRSRIIPFNSTFKAEDKDVDHSKHIYKMDQSLSEDMSGLGPAMMWLLLQNYDYNWDGKACEEVVKSSTEYISENDPTPEWIENNFEKSDDDKSTLKMLDLYSAYLKYMKSNHSSIAADTRAVFVAKIEELIKSSGHGEYVNGKVVRHEGKTAKNVIKGWTLVSS